MNTPQGKEEKRRISHKGLCKNLKTSNAEINEFIIKLKHNFKVHTKNVIKRLKILLDETISVVTKTHSTNKN